MGLPLPQVARIMAYTLRQHIKGGKYPLDANRCSAATSLAPGLRQDRLSRCDPQPAPELRAVHGSDRGMRRPAVSIAGGEPLLHRDMPRIVRGYIERKKIVILCTNALLLKKKIDDYEPSPFFTWSIHLDGDRRCTITRSISKAL
jgi:MoaA/NifB/PqqE/SkfB family radical SAM enzyme